MMLDRYICKRFFVIFAASALFFTLVLGLVDLFMNLWRFIVEGVSARDIAKVALLYVPKSLSFSLPLSVLFGTAYTLSDMYAKNELTVIFASGISLIRFTMPLLALSIFLAVASFYFEDRVVVPTYHQKTELQNTLLHIENVQDSDNVIVVSNGGKTVYKASFYDDEAKMLFSLYVVSRDENGTVTAVTRAPSARWENDAWELYNATRYAVTDEGELVVESADETVVLNEPPESFQKIVLSCEELNVQEAREYIAYLRRAGLPYDEALSVYYKKYSFPFILFIVVFLSVGLSGKTQKNVLLVSLVLCVGAAVVYYVTQMVTMLLAQFGYISPLAGAWMPVFLFIIICCVLLKFTRT